MGRFWHVLATLATLAGCGEGPDEQAFARCKDEVGKAMPGIAGLRFPSQRAPELRDDQIYGWHLDIEVEAVDGAGSKHRAGYRCLFLVEDRSAPLFLAVVER